MSHLESRIRYSGDWTDAAPLDRIALLDRLAATIQKLHIRHVREQADRYVRDKASLALWSREFFLEIMEKIKTL